VLQSLMALRHEALGKCTDNPFHILCGTSAGALNAAALACRADNFTAAVAAIARLWGRVHAQQVYRTDPIGVVRGGAQWLSTLSIGWALARWRRLQPRSLLDSTPLAELLQRMVPLERLPRMLRQGHLQALAISASSYSTGEHVTFFESAHDAPGYQRSQRMALPTRLTVPHLMASAAIPFVFPAQRLTAGTHTGWYGDGTMRQMAPISPAIHLGAQRVLVIGVGRMQEPPGRLPPNVDYPPLAQIGGHALSSIFLDGLAVDVERMERINRTLALLTPEQRLATPLRPVQAMVISPSERIDEIAARHQKALPAAVRILLRGIGASSASTDLRGAALASYLLFEAPFTCALMELGRRDTLARGDEVKAFFGWGDSAG